MRSKEAMKIRVVHMNQGWSTEGFEQSLQEQIDVMRDEGFEYYDIKISSKGEHCMIIFREVQ